MSLHQTLRVQGSGRTNASAFKNATKNLIAMTKGQPTWRVNDCYYVVDSYKMDGSILEVVCILEAELAQEIPAIWNSPA